MNCGGCGEKTNLAKHHLQLYHHYLTITGVGLMWADGAKCDPYDQVYREDILPSQLEDRLDFEHSLARQRWLGPAVVAVTEDVGGEMGWWKVGWC